MQIREQGWECPKCTRVWAPKITACGACNARQTLDHVPIRPHIGSPPTTNGSFAPPAFDERLNQNQHFDGSRRVPPPGSNWNFNGDDASFVD
jgi:hypothetical protein